MKNKIFLIKFKECDYGEYDSFVVIAKEFNNVFKLVLKEYPKSTYDNRNLTENNIESIELIGFTDGSEGIVLGSYNAG